MDASDRLILELYRSARVLPAEDFPGTAMAMLRAALNFDSARLLCADLSGDTVAVQGCIMYNIPAENAQDWERIQQHDLVLPHAVANQGAPVVFHAHTLFAGTGHAVMRDYVQRYEHRNGLVMVLRDVDSGLFDGLSLYRAGIDAQFGSHERCLIRRVMPHLQEAIKLNRQLALPATALSLAGALLITQADGGVHFCAPEARQLMAIEWPSWCPARLPAALLERLRQPGSASYIGRHVAIACQRANSLLFLRVATRSPLLRLSRREMQVAGLYGRGLAAKSVAAQLGITPATARNMLQNIYQKLEVHDKAALAQLVGPRVR